MKRALLAIALALSVASCASTPTVLTGGNGTCHPSQDLVAHKTMKKVPEAETSLEDLWGLLASERKDHAQDDRDYNSLYDQCVDKSANDRPKN